MTLTDYPVVWGILNENGETVAADNRQSENCCASQSSMFILFTTYDRKREEIPVVSGDCAT